MSSVFSRRKFIETACWGGVAASVMPTVSFAQAPTEKRLVFVLLRGAMDGLHAVVPAGDPAYASTRGALAYQSSDLVMLDSLFGLPTGMQPLLPDFRRGEVLPIQGVAIPYRTRSHFDAQSILETGMNRPIGSATGWLNRAIEAIGGRNGFGIAVGGGMPKSMTGAAQVATWSPGRDMGEGSGQFDDTLARLYQMDPLLADSYTAAQTLKAQAMEASIDASMDGDMAGRRRGGRGTFRQMFDATASFLKTPEGPRIAALEFSGWDTHAVQGLSGGTLDNRLKALSEGLVGFKEALGPEIWRDTVVVVATEFGRTAAANGSKGTDHGTAGATILYGGSVKGGRVLADWPGLAEGQLFESRDLRPTLDTRQVLKGVLAGHYDINQSTLNSYVFPDSTNAPGLLGLFG